MSRPACCPIQEQPSRLDLQDHVCQGHLDGLELHDGRAGTACAAVHREPSVGTLPDGEAHGRVAQPLDGKGGEQLPEALDDQVIGRDPNVIKYMSADGMPWKPMSRSCQPNVIRRHRRVRLGRRSRGTPVRRQSGHKPDTARRAGSRTPALRAGDYELIAVAPGSHGQVGRSGTCLAFRDADG